jgi:hypothetical protein
LEISSKSLAGFVAATGKTLNIGNAYDDELKKFHSELVLDKYWDEKFEFKTQSALVVALPYNKRLMGGHRMHQSCIKKWFQRRIHQTSKRPFFHIRGML